ncbi:hypothetical protein TB2_021020 [Malus domestica]
MQRQSNGGKRSTELYRRPHGQSSNGSSIIRKDGALVSLLPTATATHDGDGVLTTRGTSGLLRVLAVAGQQRAANMNDMFPPPCGACTHGRIIRP